MNRFFCVFLLLIFTICIACQNVSLNPYTDDSAEWEGNILPHQNVPDFVKRQWHDIASTSLFPLPERNWLETGLPPGLEEQVWKAWAPGAKRRWQNISPGYTNVIYDAKIDNGVISLILDGAGLVQSKDSGRTWQPVSHHLTYFGGSAGYISFDISPANPDIIAVAGAHIDRTTNGGRSWSPVIDQVLPAFKSQRIIQGRSTMSGAMAFGFLRFNADGSRVFASPGGFGHTFTPRGDIETEMAGWLRRKFIYIGDGNVSNFKAVDLGPFAGIRCILPHFSDPNLVFASFSDGSVYICRNAKVKKPVFTEFEKPAWLNGLQAIYMDVSPEDPGTLLLTMSEQGKAEGWPKSRIILAKVSGSTLDCTEIKIRTKDEYLSFASAKWNPRNPKQVFVGSKWEYNTFRVSDDGMKSFRKLHLPEELFPAEHTTGYSCPRSFVFDRKSDLSIVYSVTGA